MFYNFMKLLSSTQISFIYNCIHFDSKVAVYNATFMHSLLNYCTCKRKAMRSLQQH